MFIEPFRLRGQGGLEAVHFPVREEPYHRLAVLSSDCLCKFCLWTMTKLAVNPTTANNNDNNTESSYALRMLHAPPPRPQGSKKVVGSKAAIGLGAKMGAPPFVHLWINTNI